MMWRSSAPTSQNTACCGTFSRVSSNTTTPLPPYPPVLSRASAGAANIQDKPITAIPNHIDTGEIFRKVGAPVDFSVDESKLNLCSVGRICHQKAYDLLMTYLAEVKKNRTDFHFYLIGDGPDRARSGKTDRRTGSVRPCDTARQPAQPFSLYGQNGRLRAHLPL